MNKAYIQETSGTHVDGEQSISSKETNAYFKSARQFKTAAYHRNLQKRLDQASR